MSQCNYLKPLKIVCMYLVRIGLFTTTSIFELTSTRLRSSRSMISLGRYAFITPKTFYQLMLVFFITPWNINLQENKNVWKLVLGKHNLTAPISSYSRPEMFTKSQSYFFAQSVKTIAVTSTAKGITSKQLLIGTIGDQVCKITHHIMYIDTSIDDWWTDTQNYSNEWLDIGTW